MSDRLISLEAALEAIGALYVPAEYQDGWCWWKYPQDRQNNATVDAAVTALRALPSPEPSAAEDLAAWDIVNAEACACLEQWSAHPPDCPVVRNVDAALARYRERREP